MAVERGNAVRTHVLALLGYTLFFAGWAMHCLQIKGDAADDRIRCCNADVGLELAVLADTCAGFGCGGS